MTVQTRRASPFLGWQSHLLCCSSIIISLTLIAVPTSSFLVPCRQQHHLHHHHQNSHRLLQHQQNTHMANHLDTDNNNINQRHPKSRTATRRTVLLSTITTSAFVTSTTDAAAIDPSFSKSFAFVPSATNTVKRRNISTSMDATTEPQERRRSVTYRALLVDMPGYEGVRVPVAMWTPSSGGNDAEAAATIASPSQKPAVYNHRISIKKIGTMLLGSDFIPEFLSRNFKLGPTYSDVIGGDGMIRSGAGGNDDDGVDGSLDKSAPLIILAHGYLGSRFDLSHIGEELAREGFTVVSPEYPESLASSYTTIPDTTTNPPKKLDRTTITNNLLTYLKSPPLSLKPSSYGILGHSLGCGTALSTGDDTWVRVCIAGPSVRRDTGAVAGDKTLSIISMGDGLVGNDRSKVEAMIPSSFVRLDESSLSSGSVTAAAAAASTSATNRNSYPRCATLIFDRPDAPNHISFLAGNTNDSMVQLLSPLLPVAQTLGIPVLDFDRYKDSRDSIQTAEVVVPLVCGYFRQYLV